MAGIFISYRRDDAQGEARHLFDNLKQHFGVDRVFMDVIAIRPGEDYRKVIDSAVASCDVLITLIGREWLQSTTATGQPRLNDARDFVRLETAAALKRDVRVIPVLVHGAAMPTEEVLPDELKPLAFRNAIELSHSRWDYDVRMLIEALERVVSPTAAGPVGASAAKAEQSPPSTTPPPPRERRPAWQMAVIGAVVAAVLGGGGYWFWREPAPPSPEPPKTPSGSTGPVGTKPSVTVADFAGQAEEAAVKAARDLGLEPAVKHAVTESSRVGTVIAQNPAKGATLARGDAVELTVGAVATVAVPDLIGKASRDASLALQQGDLKVTWRRETTDAAKANAVIRQQPPAGTQVQPGTAVEVTIAVPATVEVPKLTGMARSGALSTLERASLKSRVSERPAAGERPDVVIGQDPPAGTRAKPGSVIEIQVSSADLRTVADLVGKQLNEAVDLLRKADLRPTSVKEATNNHKPGVVLRQEPAAGARVSPGTPVTLTFAVAGDIEVPKLTGMARSDALSTLERASLKSRVSERLAPRERPDVVIGQDPPAGTRAKPGSVIEVQIAVPDLRTAEVPKVTGLMRFEASSRLSRTNLNSKWETVPTRQYAPGVVVAQNPEPGAQVRVKTVVTLTVAVSPDPGVCIAGYVWREAYTGDRVCVTPETRAQAASDNAKAHYGPDSCAQGYVWREANPTDHVCVRPEVRAQAAEDNKQAASRIAR